MWNYLFGSKKEKIVPKYIYNFKRQKDDIRDLVFDGVIENENLPSQFSLRSEMPPVLDQGRLGSCVSNATANALRYCLKKEHEIEFAPSRLYMYYYTRLIEGNPNEDTGTTIRDMMKELHTYGDCHEDLWPYDISQFTKRPPNKCTKEALTHLKNFKYKAVRQNLNSIKSALYSGFPIIFGVDVYESFQSEESMSTGNIPMPNTYSEELLGGHCIDLVGYDDNTRLFTFQNSWGIGNLEHPVGDQGFFTLPYEYVLDSSLASDFWIINFWK
jgi:C1A family cysteine protease